LKLAHHCDFIVCSCRSTYLAGFGRRLFGPAFGCSTHCAVPADVRSHQVGVEGNPGTGETQRTPEGAAAFRKREASRVRV
jgi:hypothetical protein